MKHSKKNIKQHWLELLRFRRRHRRIKSKCKKGVNRVRVQNKVGIPRSFRRIKENRYQQSLAYRGKAIQHKKDWYIEKYLPTNLSFLIKKKESPLFLEKIRKEKFNSRGVVRVPKVFSIIEEPEICYLTLTKVISALLIENNVSFILDYEECQKVDLGSQILLDIILKDFMKFGNLCSKIDRNHKNYFPISIGGINIGNEDVQKMIFSIGSPVTLKVGELKFPDIIPYKLCIHDNEKEKDLDKRMEQKELDTTEMADYVINCLLRMKKELTPEKLDDLCTVIGEILINAEEHSSTKYRFSIGYFKEENIDGKHFGIFRLVIMNFGQTIYEKFSSEDCPNQEIVSKMKILSKLYTKRNMFFQREFEEENLWTLYALQEGVSSISPKEYRRGNGSIRFIESFFNIKGSNEADNVSFMNIVSGRTRIVFDGKYSIVPKTNSNDETFRVMTFNESGNIEDKPDKKCVYQTESYFPGTLISAKILLNDDDLVQIKN